MGRMLLLLVLPVGCGSTAIITHHDGRRLEATILGSNQAAIKVDGGRWRTPPPAAETWESLADARRSGTDLDYDSAKPKVHPSNSPEVGTADRSEPSDGDTDTEITTRIPRLVIKDIDHPGNVAATVGVLLIALGTYYIVVGAPRCKNYDAAFCARVFTPAVLGITLTLYGGTVYARSVSAASGTGREPHALRLRILPAFRLARGPTSAGLVLAAVF